MRKWSVVIILALAQFVMVLDGTVMNVSISTIVGDLNTTVNALQSAITFYTLTMAALMLIGAKLCARWGLLRAFVIGSIVYGIGSLLTGLSQNITTLMVGWSLIEGLGAVLVIPAIAALIAVNYKGKDRVTAYAIIGGISGAAAAAGPLIGGFVTTYFSWRYVFVAETIIMVVVLLLSRNLKSSKKDLSQKIDIKSAIYSSAGLILLVFGLLQTKTWGLVRPLSAPTINGNEITPLGISVVAYLIVAGLILLKLFYDRQLELEAQGKGKALVSVSMLKISRLRSGLSVLTSQYVITAAVFFVVPIYLQLLLGLDALETGKKIFPLSIALILFSMVGVKISRTYSPRKIVRSGQGLLVLGTVFLLASIEPELTGFSFSAAMFAVGAGLGLLSSQISNVNMSSVEESQTSEVGGLQGTFQNLGSSLGTAVIGSVLILSLTSGFVANINQTSLPPDIKTYITDASKTGVQIVSADDVTQYAMQKGVPQDDAEVISDQYLQAQLAGLKESIVYLIILAIFSIVLSKNLPSKLAAK